ncbi:OmpP1/FadL family transporter [Criblamydia sequanensis]|uniref:Outer membrane transport protein n=1 Tax=Candidatus Criblamydia sequanensis CRIB-18 TaxID=1437425 RepID=A0A090CZH3_9BACT|nr:outer membrane protein transport protein [Criblamydia sequanensis]CDR34291.1 Outer membrane transport protein [Criblamydia sequanensis CRIB-18]
MFLHINKLRNLIFPLFFITPIQAFSGGAILYEISSADTRLASAGYSSRAQDPSTVFTNPAGMSRLCRGVEFGAQTIFQHVHFNPDDATTTSGDDGMASKWLPSGSFFYVEPYGEKLTFGFGSLGYFGADLSYNHDWVGRYYIQQSLCQGLSLVPAVSYKVNDCLSFGAGLNIMYAFLKQRSAVNNALDGMDDGYFSLNDTKFGCGAVFGVLYELSCRTRFGLQYLTKVKLKFEDKPEFNNIGPNLETLLEDVGIIGSTVNLNVRVPQGFILSGYHEWSDDLALMLDFGFQKWSEFQKVILSLSDLDGTTFRFLPKYEDTWHAAFGAIWYYNDCLSFSTGVAYDSSAVTNKERTLDFPIGEQIRFGAGGRYAKSTSLIFDFSAELQWQGDLLCDVNRGPLAGRVSGVFENVYGAFLNVNVIYFF